jgi:type VI secretion system secreted protein Hcp
MAVDQFIKIEGVKGESKDKDHKDEIDVLAWSWGLSQSGSFHVGGGGGAGKVNVQDLSFTKYVDKASPVLTKMCCQGEHIDEAVLTVRKAGKKPLEYVTIIMNKVMVTSVSHGGSGGDERLTENVTLNFALVTYKYQPQKDDGSADGGTIDMGWDIEANIPR